MFTCNSLTFFNVCFFFQKRLLWSLGVWRRRRRRSRTWRDAGSEAAQCSLHSTTKKSSHGEIFHNTERNGKKRRDEVMMVCDGVFVFNQSINQ